MQRHIPPTHALTLLATAALLLLSLSARSATQVAYWDFKHGLQGWTANSMITSLRVTSEGLVMEAKSPDPFLVSPLIDCPEGQYLTITLRMRSNADFGGQIYFGSAFKEQDSRAFIIESDAKWHEYTVPLSPQGKGIRLRLDPCHDSGKISLAWVRIEANPEPLRETWGSPKELRRKKSIAAGQYGTNGGESAVTSRYLATHPSFLATFPYDGYVVPALIDVEWAEKLGLPRRPYFLHELLWNSVKIPDEAVAPIIKDLKSVKWGSVTDNFLNVSMNDGTRGRFIPDFTDDRDWAIVEHNAATAARLCREANLKGFWLDTEQYGNYRWRTESGVPEFDPKRPVNLKFPLGKDTPETLRKRGAQWIRAVQRELPAVTIIITFAWSDDTNGYGPLKGVTPFLNGVLDAIEAPGQLIHGYENTFYFGQGAGTYNVVNDGRAEGYPGDRDRYLFAKMQIRNWRNLSSNPKKYDKFVKTGMAAWVEDDPWNLWSGNASGTKISLWSNLQLALAYSDEYVWVWSEHTKYGQPETLGMNPFLASLANQTFNTGKEEVPSLTQDFASDPLARGWYFDFDMLAIGRKNPAHQVALMSSNSVPYRWKRENSALSVSGAWMAGEQGETLAPPTRQRRRYTHPVQSAKSAETFKLSFDFRVNTFGQDPSNPITLGLFHSDSPINRQSLTLQIRSSRDARLVVQNNAQSLEFALPLKEALKANSLYRFTLVYQGRSKRLQAELKSTTDAEATAKVQKAVPITGGAFVFNEIGVALWEGLTTPTEKERAYEYELVRVKYDK